MEKHTIQDGPIPLSGLSPLVVCRQWGETTDIGDKDYWEYTFPLSMSKAFTAVLTRKSGAYNYVTKIIKLTETYLRWTDTNNSNQHGSGDEMFTIIIGAI